ncbi:hypothetical protein LCGC14_1006290 [marine sediment metagenome]|uniref:Uncharacterized protein n=1 Tax=marine sediment metagenome TaxID=412755 RepID=A0A0F9N1N7_9ZZZZ
MLKRFRVSVHVEMIEQDLSILHRHRLTGRVLDFGESRTDAAQAFEELESAVLKLLRERKETQP